MGLALALGLPSPSIALRAAVAFSSAVSARFPRLEASMQLLMWITLRPSFASELESLLLLLLVSKGLPVPVPIAF